MMALGQAMSRDADADDHRGAQTAVAPKLTRQERKALDKESPWQSILKMDKASINAFVDAAKAAEKSWQHFGPVRPLSDSEAKVIFSDKKLKRRISPHFAVQSCLPRQGEGC